MIALETIDSIDVVGMSVHMQDSRGIKQSGGFLEVVK